MRIEISRDFSKCVNKILFFYDVLLYDLSRGDNVVVSIVF